MPTFRKSRKNNKKGEVGKKEEKKGEKRGEKKGEKRGGRGFTRSKRLGGADQPLAPAPAPAPYMDVSKFVFNSANITTQPNVDPAFKEVGIIHISDSAAINALRDAATGFTNMFGLKGFDNTIVDDLRNNTLRELQSIIKPNQKVCNLRMDIENKEPALIFHHVYGTLLENSKQVVPNQYPGQIDAPVALSKKTDVIPL